MNDAIDRDRVKAFWTKMYIFLLAAQHMRLSDGMVIICLVTAAEKQAYLPWNIVSVLPSASFRAEWCAVRKFFSGYRMGDPGSAIRELREIARYGSDLDEHFPDRIS